ncbi:MAG TPA: HlyD family secretion protein [Firmicutes bacterium]|nr:HlyD family secretion protein [Bacillota bacterium]
MKLAKTLIIWAVVLVLLYAGYRFLYPLFLPEDEEFDTQTTVVREGDLSRVVPADGVLVPSVLVEVKSKASGVVEEVHVEPGDDVAPGDIIAELDKEEILTRKRQIEADVAAAEAQLELTKRSLSPQQKATREAAVRDARLAFDNAQSSYDRIAELFSKGFATEQEMEDAQQALDSARENLEQAEEQLALDLAGAEEEEIAVSQANLLRRKAELDNVSEELANTTIRAPIAGTVLTRPVEIGTAVSSGTSGNTGGTVVATIGDLNTMFVEARIDETELGKVEVGTLCRITFDAFQNWLWEGEVIKIYPQGVSEQSGTQFPVDIKIDLASARQEADQVLGGGGMLRAQAGGPGMGGRGHGGSGRPAGAPAGAGAASEEGSDEGGKPEEVKSPTLYAQLTASVEIVLEDHPDVLILDARYVKFEEGQPVCFVLPDPEDTENREKRELTLGFGDGLRYEVVDGLEEGETVLLERPVSQDDRRR